MCSSPKLRIILQAGAESAGRKKKQENNLMKRELGIACSQKIKRKEE